MNAFVMCGIGLLFASPYSSNDVESSLQSFATNEVKLRTALLNRGPSYHGSISTINNDVSFVSTVLHIQGDQIVQQPVVDNDGNILLWNGEVFDGLNHPVGTSDTLLVSQRLQELVRNENKSIMESVIECFSPIKGPYSFLYFHNESGTIYFGRDPFGRRSLMIQNTTNVLHAISSVSVDFEGFSDCAWKEIEIGGIYSVRSNGDIQTLQKSPWNDTQLRLHRSVDVDYDLLSFDIYVEKFLHLLKAAIYKRVIRLIQRQNDHTDCRIGVLFSGGIDSLLLAAVLHLSMIEFPTEPIELLNIAFTEIEKSHDSESTLIAPDRLAAISGLLELEVRHYCYFQLNKVLKLIYFLYRNCFQEENGG